MKQKLNRSLSWLHRVLACSAALLTASTSAAQWNPDLDPLIEFNPGCARTDLVVDRATLDAIHPVSHSIYRPVHHALNNFHSAWGTVGMSDPADRLSPYHKHYLASTLVYYGIDSSPPPRIELPVVGWVYDDGSHLPPGSSFLETSKAHNRSTEEYFSLSIAYSQLGCQAINPLNGRPDCDVYTVQERSWIYAGGPIIRPVPQPTYGPTIETRRLEYIPNRPASAGAQASRSGRRITFACPSFDNSAGVVNTANVIVHEAWHIVEGTPSHGSDCPRGPGACAKEWDFDVPRSSRIWHQLVSLNEMDAYQTGYRYICDLTDHAREWVPVVTQQVANSETRRWRDMNLFENIENPADPTRDGNAPYNCGANELVTLPTPGATCAATGEPACVPGSHCASVYSVCEADGCCRIINIP